MTRMDRQPAVLLAEGDAVIGMDLSDALEWAGYRVLGPVDTAAEALRLLVQEKPAVAVIDVALRDGFCADLARTLRRLDVPFLVHSGWQREERMASHFQGAPWLGKPALSADIVISVNELAASIFAPVAPPRLPEPGGTGNPLIRKLEGFTTLSDADRAVLARISAEPRHVGPRLRTPNRTAPSLVFSVGLAWPDCFSPMISGMRSRRSSRRLGRVRRAGVVQLRTGPHSRASCSCCARGCRGKCCRPRWAAAPA